MTTQSAVTTSSRGRKLRAADFHAHNRGGGLFTETVNQRLAAYICVPAHRFNLPPAALTVANLVLGLIASVLVATVDAQSHDGASPVVALVALLLWQLAFSLDCADGQLARATGKASIAGARLDILCDVAIQISTAMAICASAWAYNPDMPNWIPSAFGSVAVANMVISVSGSGDSGRATGSLFADYRAPLVRLATLAVDYGARITVFTMVLAFAPTLLDELMAVFVVGNVAFLVLRIATATRASMNAN